MKKIKQEGFSALELLLLLVIVLAIGFVSWYVWHNRATPQANSTTPPTTSVAKVSTPARKTIQNTDPNYLVIKDWGIKVRLGAADPSIIEYTLVEATDGGALGKVQGQVSLSLKDSVTTDTNCKKLGIAITRQLISESVSKDSSAKKVGDYQYSVTGSPYACGNTKLDAVRMQYTGNNPSTWEYINDN